MDEDQIMLTSKEGMIVRIPVSGIRIQGRNTMGVTIMRLNEGDKVVSVAKIMESDEEENEDGSEKESFKSEQPPVQEPTQDIPSETTDDEQDFEE